MLASRLMVVERNCSPTRHIRIYVQTTIYPCLFFMAYKMNKGLIVQIPSDRKSVFGFKM